MPSSAADPVSAVVPQEMREPSGISSWFMSQKAKGSSMYGFVEYFDQLETEAGHSADMPPLRLVAV
jgi:hypothetical protein